MGLALVPVGESRPEPGCLCRVAASRDQAALLALDLPGIESTLLRSGCFGVRSWKPLCPLIVFLASLNPLPTSLDHSLIHSATHSIIHLLIHSPLTHSLTHSLTHLLIAERVHGQMKDVASFAEEWVQLF